jgi:hypothetical protein
LGFKALQLKRCLCIVGFFLSLLRRLIRVNTLKVVG